MTARPLPADPVLRAFCGFPDDEDGGCEDCGTPLCTDYDHENDESVTYCPRCDRG